MRVPMEGLLFRQGSIKGLSGRSDKDLKGACEGFEAYLVYTMLQECQRTTSLSEKSQAEQTYFSMMNEKVAEVVARKGIGVKEMLLRYLKGTENPKVMQEKADNIQK
jgi:Rod binding domain-containing protein